MEGLGDAGKTTILYKMLLNEVVITGPTQGFNVETVEQCGMSFLIWDLGGNASKRRLRPLIAHYYADCAAIIFVVDATDGPERLAEAREELRAMLGQQPTASPLLVFANKQDLPGALATLEIADVLDLHSLKRNWHVEASSGVSGMGLHEGLDWLAKTIELHDSQTCSRPSKIHFGSSF